MARRKRKSPLYCQGVAVTKERQHQNGGVICEPINEKNDGRIYIKRYRAQAECILDAYLVREKITEIEYEAGMKFRKAYLRAVLRIKIGDGGAGCHGDREMAALTVFKSEKILNAAYAVLSSAQKTIVIKVCGHDEYAGDSYRVETLRRGLEKLIKLWRLA